MPSFSVKNFEILMSMFPFGSKWLASLIRRESPYLVIGNLTSEYDTDVIYDAVSNVKYQKTDERCFRSLFCSFDV